MALSIKHLAKQQYPLRSAMPGCYIRVLRCETNGASAPDGVDPSAGVTWAITGTGVLTATFDADWKPRNVLAGIAYFEEVLPEAKASYTGYNATTGVCSFSLVDEDDTSGISAAANQTDQTLVCVLFCTDSSIHG